MAIHDMILHPAGDATRTQVLTVSSSAELSVTGSESWAFIADAAVHIAFGRTGMAAADASDWRIPADSPVVFNFGILQPITHIRVFNPAGTTTNFFQLPLARS